MVTENYRQLAIQQVAAMLKMKEDMGSVESIARRLGVTRSRLYQLAWAYNEKGGTAETDAAHEQPAEKTSAQPTETADRVSLPQSGKTGEN